ncbi:hypothetical protein Tco_0592122, partial [Tanacetum coccineum]
VDIQAFLLSDELDKDSNEEEVLAAGDDMDEDPQDDKEFRTPSLKQINLNRLMFKNLLLIHLVLTSKNLTIFFLSLKGN